ncbi:MAG: UDP-N-acetylglucosamine 2-epimerase (non-hydrolyzing) [Deltaproteobacteria bacterium]
MKVLTLIGTRPEAIKLAPFVAEARRRGLDVVVCATAQHRDLLDPVLELFGIECEHDLDLMRPDQSLSDLTARAIVALDPVVSAEGPDWIIVQGDTTTAMVGSLVGFYHRVAVGHVEAGLRTGDLLRPFPEELNRRWIDVVAAGLFAPTASTRDNLLREGADPRAVHVTGNTVVDALHWVRSMAPPVDAVDPVPELAPHERLVLVTAHRRESFGEGMRSIANALADIATTWPDVRVVYPVHPNPNVRRPMYERLAGVDRVHLIEPLGYLPFVRLMARAHLIVSDSGGVQEEAPSLGVPALVLRDVTERPEAIAAGAVRLIGTDPAAVLGAARRILDDPQEHARMARVVNPYGDGHASERIVSILRGESWTPFEPGADATAGAGSGTDRAH